MPYKNIVFVKLEKRLLNDYRWYMMSESAQLNYIKLILLAAETYNKIPRNEYVLMRVLKTQQDEKTFIDSLNEIKANFKKLKGNKHFYYFKDFHEKTNYIPSGETPGKSRGLPKEVADKEKEEDKEKEKEEDKKGLQDTVFKGWNTMASKTGLATLRSLSPGRKKCLRARLANPDFVANFDKVLAEIAKSSFLLGKNKQEWKVGFDWIIHNDDNYVKVLEGKYKSKVNGLNGYQFK